MMLKQTMYIPNYDWEVTVYYNNICIDCIISSLRAIGCKGDKLYEIVDFLEQDKINTGCIYSNNRKHQSVIVIGRSSNLGEFINTIEHEKNHLEMHICKSLGIDPYSEDAAVLSGYISQLFLDKALSTIITDKY